MTKTNLKLNKGEITVFDFDGTKLHAYKTNDALCDESFLIEGTNSIVALELPAFHENLSEFKNYIRTLSKPLTDVIISCHPGGADYFEDAKIHMAGSTARALGENGGIMGLIKKFTVVFGKSFDEKLPKPVANLNIGENTIGGIKFIVTENGDGTDIEIPSINCVYTHMLGADVHSILAGSGHMDAVISQLEGYKAKNYALVLSSHYEPEELSACDTKIAYVKKAKELCSTCSDSKTFIEEMKKNFPSYSGVNYLEMTAGMCFA